MGDGQQAGLGTDEVPGGDEKARGRKPYRRDGEPIGPRRRNGALGSHKDTQVRTMKAGRHAMGGSLYLEVDPGTNGSRRWFVRVIVKGTKVRRTIGLGGYDVTPLADARDEAKKLRALARSGVDPLTARKKAMVGALTFEQAARQYIEENKLNWTNPKHSAQWTSTLATYAFPVIGRMLVSEVATPDVLRVLKPVWLTKQETARRVRQRMGVILDWAKAHHMRAGDNPIEGTEAGLPEQKKQVEHHAALAYTEVGGFIRGLAEDGAEDITKLALEFLILTACRSGEVRGALWGEIDLGKALWTIPAERMKARKDHVVPLSGRAVEILQQARALHCNAVLVFPSPTTHKPLSDMALTMFMRRRELPITAHGFRSSFRDWAAEETNTPSEVVEMALAHAVKSKVEAAYRRGDLLEKRKVLMAAWGSYLMAPAGNSNVVRLPQRQPA